jgi:hypothetical protein
MQWGVCYDWHVASLDMAGRPIRVWAEEGPEPPPGPPIISAAQGWALNIGGLFA